jgi:hypothetical protein
LNEFTKLKKKFESDCLFGLKWMNFLYFFF